ncbi:MAG: rare lipoprotein A [Myxococcota bacterium]
MRLGALLLVLLCSTGCARVPTQVGMASWYGPGFRGKPTASGVRFRPGRRTAAHKTLPFGTVVKVTRTDTTDSVRVVINDRGPYAGGRVIDLSKRAARKVDMLDDGVVPVEIRVVGCRRRYDACNRGS